MRRTWSQSLYHLLRPAHVSAVGRYADFGYFCDGIPGGPLRSTPGFTLASAPRTFDPNRNRPREGPVLTPSHFGAVVLPVDLITGLYPFNLSAYGCVLAGLRLESNIIVATPKVSLFGGWLSLPRWASLPLDFTVWPGRPKIASLTPVLVVIMLDAVLGLIMLDAKVTVSSGFLKKTAGILTLGDAFLSQAIRVLVIGGAILQFPLYGFIISYASMKRTLWLKLCASVVWLHIVVAIVLCVVVALTLGWL